MGLNRKGRVCAALWLAIMPTQLAGQAPEAPSNAQRETKDRLSPEELSDLVAVPMSVVEAQGLAAGVAAFERLLSETVAAHGDGSVEVADLLTAFGVDLYVSGGETGNREIRRRSLTYLAAAIPVYRAAFGDAHPEVALALNSYANAELEIYDANPPESAEAALEEAYRIRLGVLGPTHVESLANLRSIATIRGHPSRTRGNRARIEAAGDLFRRLIELSPNDFEQGRESAPYAHAAFARMYARNGMVNEARTQLRLGAEKASGWEDIDQCMFAQTETTLVAELLVGKNPRLVDSIPGNPDEFLTCLGLSEGALSKAK